MIKNKIQALLPYLNQGLYEKEKVMQLSLLSSLAGESIFLLGPPGVAKSLIARKLKHAYQNSKAFEYLMSRFSTPDEVFGPVSIKKLKDCDQYVRLTEQYLPGANIIFLDEIWKAGPPIQNALLTVLNEKIYRNGEQEIRVNFQGLISASNELPTKDEGLEALWDRFLLRFLVSKIQDISLFQKMLSDTQDPYADNVPNKNKITPEEYKEWSQKISQVKIPEYVLHIIEVLCKQIEQRNQDKKEEEQILVSDRRWKKIIRLLRTSAFLNERDQIDLMDCFLIVHCLWNKENQIQEMQTLVSDTIQKQGYKIDLDFKPMQKELADLKNDVESETKYEKMVKYKEKKIFYDKYYKAGQYLISLKNFNQLRVDSYENIDLDHGGYLTMGLRLKLNKGKTKIIKDDQEYPFEMEEKEKKEKFTKKPHLGVKKIWEKRVAKLLLGCQQLLAKIEEYKAKDLAHVMSNLFVEKELSKIVFANLDSIASQVHRLKVEVEKTKHYYDSIE